MKDQTVGLSMLLLATAIFIYYTIWTFITPFIPSDNAIQLLFPDRYWAIALPVLALILGTCLVGVFIGTVLLKSAKKSSKKSS
ncbi:hypothetical protein DAMA08_024070 [Martiniozyma asiatica (nom. inval.)]|nr:hypothetical protein DAMA08_024070 [Martiniozyma asiatica]